jgi:O-antigen ligase
VAPVSAPPLPSRLALVRRLRGVLGDASGGALVLAAALPLLFLHERYQPALAVGVGRTSLDLRPSDGAILAIVAAALAARSGLARLRAGVILWLPGVALLAWLAFEAFRPAARADARFDDHLVSFLKLVEYALLAAAVPLLVRHGRDLSVLLGAALLWAALAAGVGLLQLVGLDVFDAWNPGWRQPSFLGHHDLAALAALAAASGVAGVLAGRGRIPAGTLLPGALAAGLAGLVLAGSVAAAGGFALGALAASLAARPRFRPSPRRLLAVAAIVATVGGGVTLIRGEALSDFLRFLGVHGDTQPRGVETYSQRAVLAYIGLRIFQDHPLAGVGWQRSGRAEVFEPYLADAHERFPDVVELAFPAPGREWGVQNLYIQLLADAGVVGFALLLWVGAAGLVLALRAAARAPNPWAAGAGLAALCGLLTLGGEWASLGLVAGIPLQAATSLLLGLAATGAATVWRDG